MEGLEITELKLSKVAVENEKLRIDSAYFGKAVLTYEKQIRSLKVGAVPLGEITSVFRKGIFDINADSYTERGVPFVRITNLRHGLIDGGDLAFIPDAISKEQYQTELVAGDLILSKTAYPAASFVTLPRCNVSQDTIAVSLSGSGRRRFKAEFIVAYLNTHHGLALMERQFQGNVQMHLSLPDGKKIVIPAFGDDLQEAVASCLTEANRELENSKALYTQAEKFLLHVLGLENWQPPEPLTYEADVQWALGDERLDAEHYHPKYVVARDALTSKGAKKFRPLREFITTLTNGQTPLRHDLSVGEVPFLCAEHVGDFQVTFESDKRVLRAHHETLLSRTALKNGDMLLTIKGRVGNAGIVENLGHAANINQDVALLRLTDELPHWFIVAYMNSLFGKLMVEQWTTGAINPFLGLNNVERLPIPVFKDGVMERIAQQTRDLVRKAHAARRRAHELLERAKRAVEIAIEESEPKALAQLRKKGSD